MLRRLREVGSSRWHVIVVIDGLRDDPADQRLVHEMQDEFREFAVFLQFPNRLGKGGAVREGVRHAHGKFVAFIDADLVIDPSHLSEMQRMLEEDASVGVVIGKRVRYETSVMRAVLSFAYRVGQCMLFFGTPWDTQAGCKMLRLQVARALFADLRTTGYAFDVELLLRAFLKGIPVVTHPVVQRKRGHSNVSARTTVRMLYDTLLLYFWFLPKEISYVAHQPVRALLLLRHAILLPLAVALFILCLGARQILAA